MYHEAHHGNNVIDPSKRQCIQKAVQSAIVKELRREITENYRQSGQILETMWVDIIKNIILINQNKYLKRRYIVTAPYTDQCSLAMIRNGVLVCRYSYSFPACAGNYSELHATNWRSTGQPQSMLVQKYKKFYRILKSKSVPLYRYVKDVNCVNRFREKGLSIFTPYTLCFVRLAVRTIALPKLETLQWKESVY